MSIDFLCVLQKIWKYFFQNIKIIFFKTCPCEDIWVRIAPQCQTWRLNGVVLHVRPQKPRSYVIAGGCGTIKVPSVSKATQVSTKQRPKFWIPWRLHINLLIPSGRWTKCNHFFPQKYCIMKKHWCVQMVTIGKIIYHWYTNGTNVYQ